MTSPKPSPQNVEFSLNRRLSALYERRTVVEQLIRSLEAYQRKVQARTGDPAVNWTHPPFSSPAIACNLDKG